MLKGKVPQSIESFFRSTDLAVNAIEAGKNNSGDVRQNREQAKSLMRASLEIAKTVNPNELNDIYREWGSHFSEDFLPAVRLSLEAIESNDASTLKRADIDLARWNQWVSQHGGNILAELKKRYEFEDR